MNVKASATLACALKSLIGYQSHQLTSVCKSVFSKHVTVQQQIVLGFMYSALPLWRQHIYGKNYTIRPEGLGAFPPKNVLNVH